jgi:hypothetical protein
MAVKTLTPEEMREKVRKIIIKFTGSDDELYRLRWATWVETFADCILAELGLDDEAYYKPYPLEDSPFMTGKRRGERMKK